MRINISIIRHGADRDGCSIRGHGGRDLGVLVAEIVRHPEHVAAMRVVELAGGGGEAV